MKVEVSNKIKAWEETHKRERKVEVAKIKEWVEGVKPSNEMEVDFVNAVKRGLEILKDEFVAGMDAKDTLGDSYSPLFFACAIIEYECDFDYIAKFYYQCTHLKKGGFWDSPYELERRDDGPVKWSVLEE